MRINRRIRKIRSVEKKFLRLYSAWQETHQLELADGWMALLGDLLRLNPHYSVRQTFQQSF